MSDIFDFGLGSSVVQTFILPTFQLLAGWTLHDMAFSWGCLPGCFAGRLQTAAIVLLYLSPGFSEADLADAQSEEGKNYRLRSWQGDEPFRDTGLGQSWLASRTKIFCEYGIVKRSFAFLNIGAYHSKDLRSYSSLLALPSSREREDERGSQ